MCKMSVIVYVSLMFLIIWKMDVFVVTHKSTSLPERHREVLPSAFWLSWICTGKWGVKTASLLFNPVLITKHVPCVPRPFNVKHNITPVTISKGYWHLFKFIKLKIKKKWNPTLTDWNASSPWKKNFLGFIASPKKT